MVRDWLLRDMLGAFESAEPMYRADPVDEYRELTILAGAWEHGALQPVPAEGAAGHVDDAELPLEPAAKPLL